MPAKQVAQRVEGPATQPVPSAFYLSEAEVADFLHITETSPDASLLSAPRMTLFNGQRAYVSVGTQRAYIGDFSTLRSNDGQTKYEPIIENAYSGILMDVQATASADRTFVTMTLRPKVSILAGMKQKPWPGQPAGSSLLVEEPQIKSTELKTTFSVPNNGTIVLGGMIDPGVGKDIGSSAATQPAGKPRLLFLLVKPTLIIEHPVPNRN